MNEDVFKPAKVAKAPAKAVAHEPYYLRLRIDGLQAIDHEPGIFELRIDTPKAEVPDLTEAHESIVAAGFDREIAERALDRFVEDLTRRQMAQYLASRVHYA
jgi:hypothetical protein